MGRDAAAETDGLGDTVPPKSAPAETLDALQAGIAASYPHLRGQMKKVAEFLIERPDEIAFSTITDIAGQIGVQPSSVVRFAKAFGYDGYSDLQKLFRSHVISATRSYAQRIQAISSSKPSGGRPATPDEVLSDFVNQGVTALQSLRDETRADAIADAVDLISGARDVYLLAQGRAFPVAFYLYYALSNLDRRAILLDNTGGLIKQQSRFAQDCDVIIAISFKSYSPSVIDIAQDRAAAGVPVVSITDSVLSPIYSCATVAFDVPEREAREFRTLVAPICLAQALVVAVGHRLVGCINRREVP